MDSKTQLCQLCNKQDSKYTCPKCEIPYCSLTCYKSSSHQDCSENFYKNCVEEELKLRDSDIESQKKMLEILQRMKSSMEEDVVGQILKEEEDSENSECSDEEFENLDSDDDEEIDLEKRIQNINLDDPNAIWSVLTEAEKQEFEAMIKNGEAEKLVPSWEPWWTFYEDQKLVEEVSGNSQSSDFEERCPKILTAPTLSEISKASPLVRHNLENVLFAYIYTVLYFNGEHLKNPTNSVLIFLDLCDNMRSNKTFQKRDDACNAVLDRLLTGGYITGENQILEPEAEKKCLEENLDSILKGPLPKNPNFYLSSSLSDLHTLFSKAKDELKRNKNSTPATDGFPKKFSKFEVEKRTKFTKKDLVLGIKKFEYYLSWVSQQA